MLKWTKQILKFNILDFDACVTYLKLVLYPIPWYSKVVFPIEEAETSDGVMFYLDT